jgi:hypothetical protein
MILFAILILIIFFSANRVVWISDWYKKIISYPYNYLFLLGLLVFGFFARLDYTDRWGCIIVGEPIFEFKNIVFSAVSISLILLSYLSKNKTLKLSFVIAELLFWTFKLFYYKGGYVVSIAAAPDPIISFFDTTTLSLRLFIIFGLLRPEIKIRFVLITTLIIMAIKVFLFPTQLIMQVEEKESLKRSEQTKQKLLGNWIGTYEYDSTYMSKTTHIVDSTLIEFKTNSITLYNFKNIDSIQFNMEFQYEYGGFLSSDIKDDWNNYYDFWIRKITIDSLDIILTQSLEDYNLKLIKTPPNKKYSAFGR